jgi:hypothetical protein
MTTNTPSSSSTAATSAAVLFIMYKFYYENTLATEQKGVYTSFNASH